MRPVGMRRLVLTSLCSSQLTQAFGHPSRIHCAAAIGRGIKQDWALAAMWFQKAAEAGDGAAACSLGAMHAEGKGVNHDGAAAAYWFHKAAKLGLHSAMFNLALCYEQGSGCEPSTLKAAYWYLRAARGSASLANLSSERVAQLRKDFSVDVCHASSLEQLDDEGDFALDSSSVRRTGTNESRSGNNLKYRVWEEQDMQPSPQDRAISMEGDQVCIDKLGRLRTKMSPIDMEIIPEEAEEEGDQEDPGQAEKSRRSKDFVSQFFSGMLGFRKDVAKQRSIDLRRGERQ